MSKRNFTTLCVTTDFYNNQLQRDRTRLEKLHGIKFTNTSFVSFVMKKGGYKLPPQALKPIIPNKKRGFRCSI